MSVSVDPYHLSKVSVDPYHLSKVSVDPYHLSKVIFCMSGRFSIHFYQCFVRFDGNNSSKSIFLFQSCCILHFGSIKADAISPNGSKIELIRERIPRFVVKTDLSACFIYTFIFYILYVYK